MNRWLPDEPLPPYSYVPNQFPHPFSDPNGHHFFESNESPAMSSPQHWQSCRSYLLGIDLFNAGYYWEAHEVWEQLWHACGRTGTAADFFKGLIKLAAAGVKLRERKPKGMSSHANRAAELFQQVESAIGDDLYFGLSLPELQRKARSIDEPFEPAESELGLLLPTRLEPRE